MATRPLRPENRETSCFISFQAYLIFGAVYLLAMILRLSPEAIGILLGLAFMEDLLRGVLSL